MNQDFSNLLKIEFLPLTEVKAKLSEQIKKLSSGKRIAITANGRPAAVLLNYEEFLSLAAAFKKSPHPGPERVIQYEDWLKSAPQRKAVSDSINRLFDVEKLSRKGQKAYKKDKVRGFSRA